jgi:hypothetical protein
MLTWVHALAPHPVTRAIPQLVLAMSRARLLRHPLGSPTAHPARFVHQVSTAMQGQRLARIVRVGLLALTREVPVVRFARLDNRVTRERPPHKTAQLGATVPVVHPPL